jgi:hypothetical protein
MTTTTLADMGVDTHRRDQWGRMLVVPPEGTQPVGYTRVTTVAKALDEGGGLAPWKATMTMLGAYARPGLRSRWETLIAATGGDPWYASPAGKAQCKALVEECAKVGGASDRAEQGTSLHALTALVDAGHDVRGLTPATEADLSAYVDKLVAEGISVVPLYGQPAVEVSVVLDRQQVAGTADRIVAVPGFELPLIADLKTGDLTYGWQAIAVQLAAYAHADAVYEQGADPNGSTDVRAPMPAVDQRHGLIINMRPGSAHVELYVVDIGAGWPAFELSLAARAWRANRALAMDLPPLAKRVNPMHVPAPALALVPPIEVAEVVPRATGYDGPTAGPTSTTGDIMAAAEGGAVPHAGEPFTTGHERELLATRDRHPSAADPSYSDQQAEADAALAAEQAAYTTEELREQLRAWLQQRIDTIGAHLTARPMLARRWADLGVPTLRSSTSHTAEQLAAIESLCDDIEAAHSLPFGPSRPGDGAVSERAWLQRVLDVFPGTTTTTNTTTTEE